MPIYTIRSFKTGKTLQRKLMTQGLGRDPVVIQAEDKALYLLADTSSNANPAKIAAVRGGSNLLITLDGSSPAVLASTDSVVLTVASSELDQNQGQRSVASAAFKSNLPEQASTPSNELGVNWHDVLAAPGPELEGGLQMGHLLSSPRSPMARTDASLPESIWC